MEISDHHVRYLRNLMLDVACERKGLVRVVDGTGVDIIVNGMVHSREDICDVLTAAGFKCKLFRKNTIQIVN